MKKLLLSAAMLLLGASAFAWNVGDEITNEVGWSNLSFESESFEPWQLVSSKGSFTKTGGLFEVYDGADVELYQIVELKAGMYRVECQGYYRCGNAWADDPAAFNTENWQDNAQLFVQNGVYDIDSQEFTVSRTFKNPLMPRLFDFQAEKIYSMPTDQDPGWDMSDGQYGDNGSLGWGPCSVPGSLAWFNAGKYQPYNDKETGVKYNTLNFFVAEDGYIKIGVMKTVAKDADSFFATNFKLYYEGEAGEAVEIAALQEDVRGFYDKCTALADENPGLLYTLVSDEVIEKFDDVYGTPESLTDKETLRQALATISEIYNKANGALTSLNNLKNSIAGMQNLANSTSYAGKEAFQAAIDKAASYVGDYEYSEGDDYSTFTTAYDELVAARGKYLQSQEAVNGMYDYTAFVAYPWFCLTEYEPTINPETGVIIPNEAANNTTASDGNLWSAKGDCDGTANDLAKGINVNGKEGEIGVWCQGGTEGGSLVLYWNDYVTCVKKWDMPHEGYHDVYQVVGGIPNGYYKAKAYGQTWMNDWSGNCHLQIYAKSSDMESFSPYLEPVGWWGWNVEEWKELETDMIQVTDGQITLGFRDNGFAAWTGMRLFYFGETPDFSALLQPSVDAVNADIDNLAWPGDVDAAKAIMANIPEKIESQDAYVAALETINKAKNYVASANAAVKTFNEVTLIEFEKLGSETYPEGAANEIAVAGWLGELSVGDDPTDTYLDAEAAAKDLAAYKNYLNAFTTASKYESNAELKSVLDRHATELKEFANAEKMAKYAAELALPYNKAVLAAKDITNASVDNPVDVTELIVNPNYDEYNKGWDGDMTVDSLGVVERWNLNSNISQTIYSLPAGAYKIQVQAFYRDHGDANGAYQNYWYNLDEETGEWANQNAKLYANDKVVSVVSIASESFTDRSYTQYVDKWTEAADADAQGNIIWEPHWIYQFKTEKTDEVTGEIYYEDKTEEDNNYPWDTKVEDLDDILFYPASLRGTACRFAKNPDAYINNIIVYVEEGGTLTFGIRNENYISNDWVTMDNWKLFYIGNDPTVAIQNVSNVSSAKTIYNVAGQRLTTPQKGINIIDGKKVFIK